MITTITGHNYEVQEKRDVMERKTGSLLKRHLHDAIYVRY